MAYYQVEEGRAGPIAVYKNTHTALAAVQRLISTLTPGIKVLLLVASILESCRYNLEL